MQSQPVALTIAGSDSGGGAGIQADLRTLAALGVHGACALTCITAQNRKTISRIEPCSPKMVRAQLESVFAETPPLAVKTGMLHDAAIVREVIRFFRRHPNVPLIVDPVMIATSGRRLLAVDAVKLLQRDLLSLATLVTPNLSETEYLTGCKIRSPEELRGAARQLHQSAGCAVLAKGGHLPCPDALDILCAREGEWLLSTPRYRRAKLHGTGCTYSAAITAWMARGQSLPQAVARAKRYIAEVIASA